MQYKGLSAIQGSLIVVEGVQNPVNGEIVMIDDSHPTGRKSRPVDHKKMGRVVRIDGDRAVIQVFEGTHNMSKENTITQFTGRPLQLRLSPDILGRVFDGLGRPMDGLGSVIGTDLRDINGTAINPVAREYPRSFIQTGISVIDGLMTLIRGQKLPIFSGDGLPHDRIAAQMLRQATVIGDSDQPFAIVFGAMGIQHDTAAYFRRTLTEIGGMDRVTMFINVS
ncbi:MAG: V-type ATP synthase subunit B, partial [Defluviitaleaceae bacterium]|nr:V-type ATP synthase subunit B [Defluviitaleaceae bacterium]